MNRTKKYRRVRAGSLVLMMIVCAAAALQTDAQMLQPLVERRTTASGPVPPECIEGQMDRELPRIDVATIPLPAVTPAASIAAPPSNTLRRELDAAQKALDRNDRAAFDEYRERVRSMLATYPPGGERRTAEEALAVYDDAARVWDAQFESPFFGESSPTYSVVRKYPGYEEAIRRQTLTRGEARFYPAAESRQFLAKIAAERARSLGVRSTARPPSQRASMDAEEDESRALPSVRPRPPASRSRKPSTSVARRATPLRSPEVATRRSTRAAAHAAPAAAVAETTSSATAPPPAADMPPAVVASDTALPPNITEPAPPLTPGAAPPATATTAPPPAPAGATAPTATTSAPQPQEEEESKRPKMIFPLILVLVGIGVLILLFRSR
jgi:hypothetical protein